MTNFPTGLDALTNPTSADSLDSTDPALKHHNQHGNANDAIEALQAKVGVNGSAVTASLDFKVATSATDIAAKYTKPGTGIPSTDMTAAVVTSLGRADVAVTKAQFLRNVKDHGATGDGVTNDTAAIQAAIDAAAVGGGIVYLPAGDYLVTSLTLKAGVNLTSLAPFHGYSNNNFTVRIKSSTPGATIIDTPVGEIRTPGVSGITVDGLAIASIGMRFRNVQWGGIHHVYIRDTVDQGLIVAAGNAFSIEDVLTTFNLANRTRAVVSGAVEIYGADHWISKLECGPGLSAQTDANMRCKALIIGCTNAFIDGLGAEIADTGILVSGNYNRFSNCRGDLNFGNGWEVTGARNTFAGCHGVGNGRAAANTYSQWKVTGTGNRFAACTSIHSGGFTVKYAFEDTVAQGPVTQRNNYDSACGGDAVTAVFKTENYVGSGHLLPPHDLHPPDGTTAVDVQGTSLLVLDLYTAATTVTSFTGGIQGQTIRILGNAFVTIPHAGGSNIRTNTSANKTLVAAKFYTFTLHTNVWYEDA